MRARPALVGVAAVVPRLFARLTFNGYDFETIVLIVRGAADGSEKPRGDRLLYLEQGLVRGDTDRADLSPANMAATAQQRQQDCWRRWSLLRRCLTMMTLLALVAAFAVIALLLAAIGLYGVLAFVVGRRSGEIGLRIAIGAQSRDVMRMVLGQGMRLLGIGLAIGLAIAAISGRIVSAQLFGVSSLDPVTFLIVAFALAAVAALACLAPAARAARVDPIDALRSE